MQRQIFAPNGVPIDSAIQTDAAINHGNSGGPLIDSAGRVIGVTSQIQTGSTTNQGNVGIGFAIPINTVRDIAGQIIANGKAQHAFLGLSAQAVTPQLQRLFNLPTASGLLVQQVTKGSGAAKAGIKRRHDPGRRRRRELLRRRRHHHEGRRPARHAGVAALLDRLRRSIRATS